MKKTIIILIITIIAIIVILSSIVVATTRKNTEATIEEKVIEELNYLNKYCISLLTNINKIVIENEVINENNLQTQFQDNTNNETVKNNSQQDTQNNKFGDIPNLNDNKVQKSILSYDGDYTPDWDGIQLEVEQLYQIWNIISLDLHTMNFESSSILAFTDVLNNVTKKVKDKNKTATVEELVKLYELVIGYTKQCKPTEQETKLLEIQFNAITAYAHVTNDKWEEAEKKINEAQNLFTNMLNTVNESYTEQSNINRSYILVNELKKAIKLRDKDIFYLNYKTLVTQFYFFID